MPKPATCLLSLALLSACATGAVDPAPTPATQRSGGVGFQDISGMLEAPAGRLALAPNESYLEPLEAVGSPMPDYPSALLAARMPPQTVCVSVAIGTQGEILGSRGIVEPPTCPQPDHPAFVDSVLATLATWSFEPARRCVFPSAAAKERSLASCTGGEPVPIAVTLTYRFVFEQHEGHGAVRRGL